MIYRFSFFAKITSYIMEIKIKEETIMQKVFNVTMIFLIGFACGMVFDSDQMANNEDYHDYWMRRSKKTE